MFILLNALWLILNGRITLEILLIGLVLCSVVYLFMCKFMDFSIKKDLRMLRNIGYGVVYFLVLLKEILVSNAKVMAIILFKKIPITPSVIKVRIDLKGKFTKAILANSITLTPGTITIKVDGDIFTVHCLDAKLLDGIESSRFVSILKKMEAR